MQLFNPVFPGSTGFVKTALAIAVSAGAFLGRTVQAVPPLLTPFGSGEGSGMNESLFSTHTTSKATTSTATTSTATAPTSLNPAPTPTPGSSCLFDKYQTLENNAYIKLTLLSGRCHLSHNCEEQIKITQRVPVVVVVDSPRTIEVDLTAHDEAGATESDDYLTLTRTVAKPGHYETVLSLPVNEKTSGKTLVISSFGEPVRFQIPEFTEPASSVNELAVTKTEDGTYKLYFRPVGGNQDNYNGYRVCNEVNCKIVKTAENGEDICLSFSQPSGSSSCVPVTVTPVCGDVPLEDLETAACLVPCSTPASACTGSGSGLGNITDMVSSTVNECDDFCNNGFQSNLFCQPLIAPGANTTALSPTTTTAATVAASTGAGLTFTSVLTTIFGTPTPSASLAPTASYVIPTAVATACGTLAAVVGLAVSCGVAVYFCRKYGKDLLQICARREQVQLTRPEPDSDVANYPVNFHRLEPQEVWKPKGNMLAKPRESIMLYNRHHDEPEPSIFDEQEEVSST